MAFNDNLDIVKFFRTIVQDLKPSAADQNVALSFLTKVGHTTITHYDSENIRFQILQLLNQIILYVPEHHKVTVLFDLCKDTANCCKLTITNTGVNLFRITAISASTTFKTTVKHLESNAIEFVVEVPLLINEVSSVTSESTMLQLKPYYAEIGKRLSTNFTNPRSFMPANFKINRKESAFLQKINTILSTKIEDNTLTVEAFASIMAMSRSQLFRKMTALTNMSPQRYILHFRLQAAKELLEAEDLDLNISDVCYGVGFMSQSHFTRSFKTQFGMLPSQLRKN